MNENTKNQAPNTKEAPNLKLQYTERAPVVWNLVLGISLELGVWGLGFSIS